MHPDKMNESPKQIVEKQSKQEVLLWRNLQYLMGSFLWKLASINQKLVQVTKPRDLVDVAAAKQGRELVGYGLGAAKDWAYGNIEFKVPIVYSDVDMELDVRAWIWKSSIYRVELKEWKWMVFDRESM